jgi:hypothetical protein
MDGMMKRHVAGDDGKIVSVAEATPVCGRSFCDECGDCLACHGGDPCRVQPEGHRWVWYPLGLGENAL